MKQGVLCWVGTRYIKSLHLQTYGHFSSVMWKTNIRIWTKQREGEGKLDSTHLKEQSVTT